MPTSPDWPLHPLPHANTPVGPCAWRASLLLEYFDHLSSRPSLLVTHPDDSLDLLASLAPHIARLGDGFPVMLCIREPQFSRRIPDLIAPRLDALKLKRVEFVAFFVDDPVDLKNGSAFQYLYHFREKGVLRHLALAHQDVRMVEWLALHTPATAILVPYGLDDPSARAVAIPAIVDNGAAAIALPPTWFDAAAAKSMDSDAIRFALGDASRALPVLDSPIPEGVTAISAEEIEARWSQYAASHVLPEPLPRSGPPPDAF